MSMQPIQHPLKGWGMLSQDKGMTLAISFGRLCTIGLNANRCPTRDTLAQD